MLALLDNVGSPGTVVANGPNYFGFIIGASLPAAAAAERLMITPVDAQGRVDPAQLPALDARTILCLQAGEVNTGAFDRFAAIIPDAQAAGAWVHVDGVCGFWGRALATAR